MRNNMNKIFILLAFLISTNLYAGSDLGNDIKILKDKMGKLSKNQAGFGKQKYYSPPSYQYSQICHTPFEQCYLPANQMPLNQQCWCQNYYTGFISYGRSK